jgi:hypothetical protein
MADNVIVHFRKVLVDVDGKEESTIAAYLVSDGIDCCRVGLLPRHLVKHWQHYDGKLAQVIEVYASQGFHQSYCCNPSNTNQTTHRTFNSSNNCTTLERQRNVSAGKVN